MLARTMLRKKSGLNPRPDFFAPSVTQIDFAYLKRLGITTCFVDLDGTVVSRGTFEVSKELAQKLRDSDLDIKIATNRPRSRSLERLEEYLSASGVVHPSGLYGKPTKRYFRAGLKEFGLQPTQVVMIGDRFLQDILGANRVGMYSLLIHDASFQKHGVDRLMAILQRRLMRGIERTYRTV